jgi:hypothetical protein
MKTTRTLTTSIVALMTMGMLVDVQAGGSVKSARAAKKLNIKHADQNKNGRISPQELKAEKAFVREKRAVVDNKREERADKDGDGTLSKEEQRKAAIHSYLKNRSEVDKKWEAKADADGSGSVSGQEYKTFRTTQMDKDGNGTISHAERNNYWKVRKSRANTDREKKYDADGDGYLNGDEARAMLRDRLRLINTHGKAKVDSDVEREFDENDDGIIDKNEAAAIKDAVG